MFFSMRLDFKKAAYFLSVLYLVVTGGGGCNLFSDFGDRNSDDALMTQATMQIDAKQWTAAINTLSTISAGGQQRADVKLLTATAYAGRGGLNLLSLAQSLQNPGGKTLFQLLMTSFTGATAVNVADEVTAEGIVQSISLNAAGRTVDQNVFMMFLELAKLGTILASDADPDNDGLLDPGFDGCINVPVADATQVATALGNLVDSVQASGSTVGASLIGTITADCASLPGLCTVYTAPSVTPLEVLFARTLVGETALGIGLAAPADTGICEIPPAGANCHGSGTGLCP